MAEQMDLPRLRTLIEGVLGTLYERYRHQDLPELCERLHLPPPPANDDGGPTKHQRLTASLQACPDGRLPQVAEAVLDSETLLTAERHALQDVVWLGRHYVEVPGRTRRELAKDLALDDYLEYPDRFLAMLGRLWDLGDDWLGQWGTPTVSLRDEMSATSSDSGTTGARKTSSSASARSRPPTPASGVSSRDWPRPRSCPTSTHSAASWTWPTSTCSRWARPAPGREADGYPVFLWCSPGVAPAVVRAT